MTLTGSHVRAKIPKNPGTKQESIHLPAMRPDPDRQEVPQKSI